MAHEFTHGFLGGGGGGYGFLIRSEKKIPTTRELEYLFIFVAQSGKFFSRYQH